MNSKPIIRKCAAVLILFSILFLFSACAKPAPQAPGAAEADEQPLITQLPGSLDKLIIHTVDRDTGVYSEWDAYCHMLYASSSNGESSMEIDCMSLFDMLPDVRDELPEISASGYEIGFGLPNLYAASFKKAEVYLTLPSGEIMLIDFNTLDEAIAYASDHFEDSDPAPVIDVIMRFKNRDAGVRGSETGEEGYAFVLIP